MGQDEDFLEAPACDLTDVPDCYVAGLDMALVQVVIGQWIQYGENSHDIFLNM